MLYITLVCVVLTISSVTTERKYSISNSTTDNPLSVILKKFHQNDYKISYEWCEIVRCNDHFGEYYLRAFKYNRTTTAFNVTLLFKLDVGYDLEVITQTYKFASNEYRSFPMRMQINFCTAMADRVVGLDKFTTSGNFSCPILKGKRYHVYNWTPDEERLPPFIPNGKYMVEFQWLYRSNEVLVSRHYGSVFRPLV